MNYSELLQLAKGWGNFISDRRIIWRLHKKHHIPPYLAKYFPLKNKGFYCLLSYK